MNGQAGKGSRRRPGDEHAYRRNHARVFRQSDTAIGTAYECPACGAKDFDPGPCWLCGTVMEPFGYGLKAEKGVPNTGCKAKNFRSSTSGCHPDQAADWNQSFGHLGVRYDHKTGDAIYENCAAERKVLHERGFVNRQDVTSG